MSASRPSSRNRLALLALRVGAAVGTVVDLVSNTWGAVRVHGSATPPRRERR